MSDVRPCVICGTEAAAVPAGERTLVRPNIRKFRDESFAVWRCAGCASIHSTDEVDLDHYYDDYPFLRIQMDWRLRAMYAKQLRRLVSCGLQKSHRILDYGCGSGNFVSFLRSNGYDNVSGYDAYGEAFRDEAALARRYDLVVAQDLVEHVASPRDLLATLGRLVEPGGLVAIGTPNAEAIDLARPNDFVHTLHQPFHRHIFSKRALLDSGKALGWSVERYYPTMYSNTLVPFINSKFLFHYFALFDDTIDLAFEPIKVGYLRLWTLPTLFWGLFGYFFAPHTDVMAVFKTPAAPAPGSVARP